MRAKLDERLSGTGAVRLDCTRGLLFIVCLGSGLCKLWKRAFGVLAHSTKARHGRCLRGGRAAPGPCTPPRPTLQAVLQLVRVVWPASQG